MAERDAARERAAAAEKALNDLRASLARAQGALDSMGTAAQRTDARQAVAAAQKDLGRVRKDLDDQPAGAGNAAVGAALAAVDAALARTAEALAATGASSGLVFASMHTSLDRAQAALDDAQTALTTALGTDPSDALRVVLSQAQGALTTAQVSLVPLLRQELETAEGELDTARSNVREQRGRAEKAEGERDTARSERDTARSERDTARSDAGEQRNRADKAEGERDTARSEAEEQRDRADSYDPRVSLTTALLPREERFVPRGDALGITRTPRTDSGEPDWAKLAIRTAPVAFAAGMRVAAADGGLVATDELPLRSVTLRAAGRHPIKIQGDDGTPTTYGNTDGVMQGSLRIRADGATLKFGGEGLVYYDMQRQFNYHNRPDGTDPNHNAWWRYGPDGKLGDASAAGGGTITASHARDLGLDAAGGTLTADQATALQGYADDNSGACWRDPLSDCGDWAHDDLTVAFGAPSQSPQGEAAYYWKVRAPFTELQRDTGLPTPNIDGRPQDLGTYELWLSNYGGVDNKGTDTESDDTHRYLDWSSYGLFQFFDNVVQTPIFLRPQAFAFGYDAFRDADGMRTTDLGTSVAATFKGHTMARELLTDGSTTHVLITGADILRGDITLNACIGGSGCTGTGIPTDANKINGRISLEELRHDGTWIPVRYGTIPMAEGDIAADGSFKGAIGYPADANGVINSWEYNSGEPGEGGESRYGGNFYGPRDGLEAAGWWYVQPDARLAANGVTSTSGIIGSFGAECGSGCN